MADLQSLSTKQKALKLNLDHSIYGTFAEIGAGQEVARFFFKAGGASGTVAKSISAYDMAFSDAIYGREQSGRYVCKSRLIKMLNYEYDLLLERLQESRGDKSKFFSFANTVAATSFSYRKDAHGWLGIRFQTHSGGPCSDIILHVDMLDNQNQFQQEALGIIGVNLVYGAYFHHEKPEQILGCLTENLGEGRVSINMIQFNGPAFAGVDNRIMNLELVKRKYCDAIMFNEFGEVVLARDLLYKKNVQVVRGSFRPPTLVNLDIIKCGLANYAEAIGTKEDEIFSIAEITMKNLNHVGFDSKDFLARVDLLAALGQRVLISNFAQYYKLTDYFHHQNTKSVALILGGVNFKQIFDEAYYESDGGIFAALGQLFKENHRLYVYPYKEQESGESIDIFNLSIPPTLKHLYQYLIDSKQLLPIENYDDSILHIYSRKVLNMIQTGEEGWEGMVPKKVSEIIKSKKLFGCGG
ncbi:MAG: TonB-dependent receptor [Halobacteriovoraceae bacterium]|nr:TonB-dependent receptor [Halobacteriovoraceae bacterium]MCB9095202.1 TonB-dependent receptor [Halobacteriovoraceae bacterium]